MPLKVLTRGLSLLPVLASTLLAGCLAAPPYEGPATDHFDGERFRNSEPMDKSAWDMVKLGWGALLESEDWPDQVEVETGSPADRVEQGMSITFISHATVLVQVAGLNILTDPVYSERASPFQWVGPKRVHEPGVALEDLPPIDVILISHNHYDALDEATLLRIQEQQASPPLVVAGLGNGALFEDIGLENHLDLDWEQSTKLGDIEIIFTECRHRSGRGLGDQMKTLWGAFVIKTPEGNIYFGGDSGYGAHFAQTGERHGPFALALLPIGAYEPRWFMADVHLDPEESVRAHLDLGSRNSVGVHFGTFQLTYEGREDPERDLAVAIEKFGLEDGVFRVIDPGETLHWPRTAL